MYLDFPSSVASFENYLKHISNISYPNVSSLLLFNKETIALFFITLFMYQ